MHIDPRLKGAIQRPAASNPSGNCAGGNPQVRSPLCDSQAKPFMNEELCIVVSAPLSSIICLLKRGCPSAIFGAIRPIVINSIERCAFRPVAHVCVKGSKRVAPSIADVDSPSSIPPVCNHVGVVAPVFHGVPNAVFLAAAQTMSPGAISKRLSAGFDHKRNPGVRVMRSIHNGDAHG